MHEEQPNHDEERHTPAHSVIVVGIGGNALVHENRVSLLDQLAAVEALAPSIVDVTQSGHRVVVTHGNGPQVGYILRRSELAIAEVAPITIDFAVADTQGAIGHMSSSRSVMSFTGVASTTRSPPS